MSAPLITGAIIGGIARSLLAGLGIGVVTFVGLDMVMGQIETLLRSQLSSVAGSAMQVAGLAGLGQAINIILSAYTVRIALVSLKKFRIL